MTTQCATRKHTARSSDLIDFFQLNFPLFRGDFPLFRGEDLVAVASSFLGFFNFVRVSSLVDEVASSFLGFFTFVRVSSLVDEEVFSSIVPPMVSPLTNMVESVPADLFAFFNSYSTGLAQGSQWPAATAPEPLWQDQLQPERSQYEGDREECSSGEEQ